MPTDQSIPSSLLAVASISTSLASIITCAVGLSSIGSSRLISLIFEGMSVTTRELVLESMETSPRLERTVAVAFLMSSAVA
ncbi:MAG: hypothetical protein AO394_05590 [Candidatus Fermentibacter daniensis]|nr:MAG: hypothetical protein AO394_05590 [Candidatus Fermentibacter daniensis]